MKPTIKANLLELDGQILTTRQVLEAFGYSPKTYIMDTVIYQRNYIKAMHTNPETWRIAKEPPEPARRYKYK